MEIRLTGKEEKYMLKKQKISVNDDWWDVIGGAAIGTASSYIFTRPFARKHNITFSPVILSGQHPGFYASIRF